MTQESQTQTSQDIQIPAAETGRPRTAFARVADKARYVLNWHYFGYSVPGALLFGAVARGGVQITNVDSKVAQAFAIAALATTALMSRLGHLEACAEASHNNVDEAGIKKAGRKALWGTVAGCLTSAALVVGAATHFAPKAPAEGQGSVSTVPAAVAPAASAP